MEPAQSDNKIQLTKSDFERTESEDAPGDYLNRSNDCPTDILSAAYKVGAWAKQQGWRAWRIGPVADQRAGQAVVKVRAKLEEYFREGGAVSLKGKPAAQILDEIDEIVNL